MSAKIAETRGLKVGEDAISPARFPEWTEVSQFRAFADEVRERTGGIPIGFKLSAQHIEQDIDAALAIGCDYIILDGRGGATGAAPLIFRDNISVPTIPALARARRHRADPAGGQRDCVRPGGEGRHLGTQLPLLAQVLRTQRLCGFHPRAGASRHRAGPVAEAEPPAAAGRRQQPVVLRAQAGLSQPPAAVQADARLRGAGGLATRSLADLPAQQRMRPRTTRRDLFCSRASVGRRAEQ